MNFVKEHLLGLFGLWATLVSGFMPRWAKRLAAHLQYLDNHQAEACAQWLQKDSVSRYNADNDARMCVPMVRWSIRVCRPSNMSTQSSEPAFEVEARGWLVLGIPHHFPRTEVIQSWRCRLLLGLLSPQSETGE